MLEHCEYCGKTFYTDYPTKLYCSENCSRQARWERDESYYNFPREPNAEPIFSFQCKNCGKEVKIYSKYDQRISFCCGICAKKYHNIKTRQRLAAKKSSNIGMSGGMSFGSLIYRESRSVDREKVIEVKICPVCGKKFEVTPRRQKYCSLACQQTELLQRLKETKTDGRPQRKFQKANL